MVDPDEEWAVLRCIKGMELASLEKEREKVAETNLLDLQVNKGRMIQAEKVTVKATEENPDKLAEEGATLVAGNEIKLQEEEIEREGSGLVSFLFCRCCH